jgi:glycosyl transferase family 2
MRLSPIESACELTVVIPARNEAHGIARTLAAFARQSDDRGERVAPERFDIVVLANNCSDGTAETSRAWALRHPRPRVHVLEVRMPHGRAHVGEARRLAFDIAVQRFVTARREHGIVATTDADTIVADDWVSAILDEMRTADAVAGHVTIAAREVRAMPPGLRALYEHELAYRAAFAAVEHRFDPLPQDPAPRHSSFVGASFAVSAAAYAAAGGLPRVSPLEDRAFYFALRRIDARVRHSMRVRATTSSRRDPRVHGGFGTFLAELEGHAGQHETFLVEHAQRTLAEVRLRATLRSARAAAAPDDAIARLEREHGVPRDACAKLLDRTQRFGCALERALRYAKIPAYGPQPVEAATATLRAAFADPMPAAATRMSAASGAG